MPGQLDPSCRCLLHVTHLSLRHLRGHGMVEAEELGEAAQRTEATCTLGKGASCQNIHSHIALADLNRSERRRLKTWKD